MKFLCGSCRTKYQISNEKVRGKILTIRCKKCGAKIVVRESLAREAGGGTAVAPVAEEEKVAVASPKASIAAASSRGSSTALASAYQVAMQGGEAEDMPTSVAPVPANLDVAGVEWYVAVDGQQHGPFAFAEVVRRLKSKEIVGRHYVWHDGMDNWKRVREVADLEPYLAPAEKKKPPPPPLAEAGGQVVDFASRRAERERSRGSSQAPIADSDPTAIAEPILGQKLSPPPSHERADQLDDVLNEALGIAGEGKTTRAEPERAVAVAGTARSASGKKGDGAQIDDLTFDPKEDIFANVPRASDADLVQRESTRFFVAAAGVNRQRSRNRLGIMLGAAAAVGAVGLVIALVTGVIQIRLPGVGNPFASDREAVADLQDGALGDEDPEELRKLLPSERKAKRAAAAAAAAARRKAAAAPARAPSGLGGDYVDDGPADGELAGSRGPRGAGSVDIDTDFSTGGAGGVAGLSDSALPRSGVEDVPVPDSDTLSEEAITRVINSRKKSVSICYTQALRAREDLRGKLKFLVTVEPTGRVSKAAVETTSFKGSKLGDCIANKIKDWKFPTFQGEAQQVVVPFVLEQQNY